MEKLLIARRPFRDGITDVVNQIQVELLKEVPDSVEVEFLLQRLDRTGQSLEKLDQNILEVILKKKDPQDEYSAEVLAIQEFENKAMRIRQKVQMKFNPVPDVHPSESNGSPSICSTNGTKKRTFKLPKIEMKKFNGELTEWLGWWSQFQKIHEDEDLHASDKMSYLLQSMIPNSRAHDLVQGYPQTGDNYPKVIIALKERFGKDDLLVEVYVRELLKLVINNVNNKDNMKLSKMFDKLESHLRALESLGITTENNAPMLFPLVESSIPEEVLRAWIRSPLFSKDGSQENPQKSKLDYLLEFLKNEIEGEERSTLARAGFDIQKKTEKQRFKNRGGGGEDEGTAAGLFVGQANGCLFCSKNHPSQECFKAQKMSLIEKKEVIKTKKCCFLCLKTGHQSKECKFPPTCFVCGGKHQSFLCPDSPCHQKTNSEQKNKQFKPKPQNNEDTTATYASQSCTSSILLQTMLVRVMGQDGKSTVARLICDSGSQKSHVLSSTVKKLKYKPVGEEWIRKTLFGGSTTDIKRHNTYDLKLQSMDGKVMKNLLVVEEEDICGRISRVPTGPWLKELSKKKIFLSDFKSPSPEIEILIGSNYYGEILTGKIQKLSCGLTAIETIFGWTLCGPLPKEESTAMIVTSLMVSEFEPSSLWDLETLGIQDPSQHKSKTERENETKKHFQENVFQNEDGRYSVSLPWMEEHLSIPDNKFIAQKRLQTMSTKLISTRNYEKYDEVFKGWELDGIIEEVPESEKDHPGHYLPHRAVFKPESLTTPVRPVFDASCKAKRSPSLNDCLEKGPNLLELIPSILLRFREGKIGVISDIKKAFLQISIKKEDREFLRFLWWENQEMKKIKIFKHNRVVFGVNCSPFLLGAVIDHHLNRVDEEDKSTADKLLHSLYVDNCVASLDTKEELEKFILDATRLMSQAKMELRQWEWSSGEKSRIGPRPQLGCGLDFARTTSNQENQTTSVLGMKWNKNKDELYCEVSQVINEKLTKRSILSCVHQIFDPMGFLCPALLEPKLLLQESWAQKTGWDDEMNQQQEERFKKWYEKIQFLSEIKIPRNMTGGMNDKNKWQMHMFCDASKDAYAATVFLRCENEEQEVSVQLLQAKSRVAPLKKTSIPRLELLSCTIGARLMKTVQEALEFQGQIHYWSDSTTVLTWIKRNDEWGTFVGNRVKEICQISSPEEWNHVPGKSNPADLPSRGCPPSELLKSKWWEGPAWLKEKKENWPTSYENVNEEEVMKERRKSSIIASNFVQNQNLPWYMTRFSSYHKCVRMIGWMLRFYNKCRKHNKEYEELTLMEMENAENTLFKIIQAESFPSEGNVISGIRVQKDSGLFCVKTKLLNREDSLHFRLPILLPNSHPFIELLIRKEHENNGHAGAQFLVGKLREKVWIMKSRKSVRKIINSCVKCRRFMIKPPEACPSSLPEDRVKDAKAFEVVGVDLAGPLLLSNKTKVWIVLFTCAIYRCVHLELVSSLSTEAFLGSFQRFIGRRGRPVTVYSDNGRNFSGASNLFDKLDWDEIEKNSNIHKIKWKFSPPAAAWWGGWWERLIRTMKDLIKRILGKSRVNYEELLTCLCEVESIMNGRPLTFITEDQDDLIPLTPSMFIQDVCEIGMSDIEEANGEDLRRKFKSIQKLKQELRERFRKEYLGLLVQKGKEDKTNQNFAVGDVVLVGADNQKRMMWPLGKVVELIPGKDGHVRVVKVRTTTGVIIRPIQRLFPLEVSSTQDQLLFCATAHNKVGG